MNKEEINKQLNDTIQALNDIKNNCYDLNLMDEFSCIRKACFELNDALKFLNNEWRK